MERIVAPIGPRNRGAKVANLQDGLALLLERGGLLARDEAFRREMSGALGEDRHAQRYGSATHKLVTMFQEENRLEASGEVDEPTARMLNRLLERLGAFGGDDRDRHEGETAYRIGGRVGSRSRPSAAGLRVVVVAKGVGGDRRLAEAETDARGAFRAEFKAAAPGPDPADRPDLQAQVYAGDRLLGESEVRYDAGTEERLDIIIGAEASAALQSEYEALIEALARHHQGDLADLEESDERRDITYLANKARWDARAVVLAVLAARLAKASVGPAGDLLDPPFFYALLRAGLPSDEAELYRIDPASVEAVWRKSIGAGIIPAALDERVDRALESFRALSQRRLLEGPAAAGVSSVNEMLATSLSDPEDRREFGALFSRHAGDPEELWRAARERLGEEKAERLRFDGQLAYLTLNNAPLIGKLREVADGDRGAGPAGLVRAGFHRAGKWREIVSDAPVPPEIGGKDDAERRDRYAQLLAARTRLSFPTAAVGQLVEDGDIGFEAPQLRGRVVGFLAEHSGAFDIGRQSVAQYVARNDLQVEPEVVRAVARVQRVYQITPDDASMTALLNADIDSAQAVMRYEADEFARAFGDKVGGSEKARLIHAKAEEVHSAVVNIALSYLTARGSPAIGVHSPAAIADPKPEPPDNVADILAYATLEDVFGGMDYCRCEHCRSVLSPAAYLVDLLLFLDRPTVAIPAGCSNPIDVLLKRRPDIEHLPLTCENTHTALPYLDIVNEALEHFVASGLSLDGYSGHSNDGSVPHEELLAAPQSAGSIADAAYAELGKANFPPPLPFHQPLEALRRYFARLEAPLAEVMEDVRVDDRLQAPANSAPQDYGWRDIWMERLGLSRAEYRLLTESMADGGGDIDVLATVRRLYGFAEDASEANVRKELDYARSFCRRVGIRYEELAEILATGFCNPGSHLIPKLDRLGAAPETLHAFFHGNLSDAEFEAELAPGLDPANYGGDIKAWVKNAGNFQRIMGLIRLINPADPDDICNFANVEFRHLEPADPDAGPAGQRLQLYQFVRLARFIRLWRKFGWSVGRTDEALSALYPAAEVPDGHADEDAVTKLDDGFISLLPRLAVTVQALTLLKLKPERDLPALLACFAPMGASGENSLYRRLLLTGGAPDPAFDEDGFGNLPASPNQDLLPHATAIAGAFRLDSAEFQAIAEDLGFLAQGAQPKLTLANLTAVFRRGWLAHTLKLSVRELLLLARSSGIDPFGAQDPVKPGLVRFVRFVANLRTAGVKPSDALYLVWNEDVSGKSAPREAEIEAVARTLRSDLRAVEAEFAHGEDPGGSITRSRMALIYGSEAAEFFFSLIEGRLRTVVEYAHATLKLPQAVQDEAPSRLNYDPLRRELACSGRLSQAEALALQAAAAGDAALQDALGRLKAANDELVHGFFARYPDLEGPHDDYAASGDPPEVKRAALLESLLPGLRRRRQAQKAMSTAAALAGLEPTTASGLLDDAAVLHSLDDASAPAAADLVAIGEGGLSARFFHSADVIGNPDEVRDAQGPLEYGPGLAQQLPPNPNGGAPVSGVWSGFLEVPESGVYDLRVESEPGAEVALALDGDAVDLSQTGGLLTKELQVGELYPITLTVRKVTKELALRWRREGSGWETVPAVGLYSETLMNRLRGTITRFLKSAALAQQLSLTAEEMRHLTTHPNHLIAGEGWLNRLPTDTGADPATGVALFGGLRGLLDYSGLKSALSPDNDRLLRVCQDPAAAATGQDALLFTLTRWDEAGLDGFLQRFGLAKADLGDAGNLRRVRDGFRWAGSMRIPVQALLNSATNGPGAETVRSLQSALRARYEPDTWLKVLKPINDELRVLQRDALVAYILHQFRSSEKAAPIDTPEKLFEYFLMDVQMDPCMLTSRVRHALSSVQLFVDRCLLGMEKEVSPKSIKAKQWEWMKRYRVWEVVRKIFLWPENLLEPELRDDQSPFFREFMAELLQGDITDDRAAEALIGYLGKLETVAKLEVCGMHLVENDPAKEDDVLHVVGRTAGANRKYFYRKRDRGSWTAWEKIDLEIEDDPVLPVVWQDRLFLFWLKLVSESEAEPPTPPADTKLQDLKATQAIPKNRPTMRVKAILNWSEHFGGKWQPMRTSDPAEPLLVQTGLSPEQVERIRSQLRLAILEWPDGGLRVIVSYQGWQGSSFYLHNAFGTPELRSDKKEPHFAPRRRFDTVAAPVKVSFQSSQDAHQLLSNSRPDGIVQAHHPTGGEAWDPPFFYQDSRHAFYVTARRKLKPVPEWNRWAIIPEIGISAEAVAGIVPPRVPFGVDVMEPKVRQPGFGAPDRESALRYVELDQRIETMIATPGTVLFDGKVIAPSGGRIHVAPSGKPGERS